MVMERVVEKMAEKEIKKDFFFKYGVGRDENEEGNNDEHYDDDLIKKVVKGIIRIFKVLSLCLPRLPLDPLEFLNIRSVDLAA